MSTQSGIKVSQSILESLGKDDLKPLIVRVSNDNSELIRDENFIPHSSDGNINESIADVKNYLSETYPNPAYAILRRGDRGNIFLSFIPDNAPIRQKMLYASTRNTLVTSISSFNFHKDDIREFTDLDDLELGKPGGVTDANSSLTPDEKELDDLNTIRDLTVDNGFRKELTSMSSSQEKLIYGFDQSLEKELSSIFDSDNTSRNFLAISIDSVKELIFPIFSDKDITLNTLSEKLRNVKNVPEPYYTLYSYSNRHFAFIYSCPSGSKVRDRMTYASFKQGLFIHLKKVFDSKNLKLDKSLEIGDPEELDLSSLGIEAVEVERAPVKSGLKFGKPKGPRRR